MTSLTRVLDEVEKKLPLARPLMFGQSNPGRSSYSSSVDSLFFLANQETLDQIKNIMQKIDRDSRYSVETSDTLDVYYSIEIAKWDDFKKLSLAPSDLEKVKDDADLLKKILEKHNGVLSADAIQIFGEPLFSGKKSISKSNESTQQELKPVLGLNTLREKETSLTRLVIKPEHSTNANLLKSARDTIKGLGENALFVLDAPHDRWENSQRAYYVIVAKTKLNEMKAFANKGENGSLNFQEVNKATFIIERQIGADVSKEKALVVLSKEDLLSLRQHSLKEIICNKLGLPPDANIERLPEALPNLKVNKTKVSRYGITAYIPTAIRKKIRSLRTKSTERIKRFRK